ncbi:MAG: DegT/DnrJ/EryC1/StrS family aminotransferase [Lachnospiraceae bacterium]|nr:DegT/DnrJ/EryC1/StrS family aminotransferase [Lachnospiraceae bacterium]
MQFRDLGKQYQVLQREINQAIGKVLENASYIAGREVTELEGRLAEYVGVKHCITCGNGTDALELALAAWNVGEGDAVFVPDFTFFASGEAPANRGAVPVFVDVDRETFNISPEALEEAVKKVICDGQLKPKAVVAVDLFGQPADYGKIIPVVQKYGLLLLEDGAQGFGGNIAGRLACSFGDISTTSFFPAKPLGCYGDGGAVFTDNDEWAEVIRSLCVHGKGSDKYDNVRLGRNSRLDTVQAAVLLIKLKQFQEYELEQVNRAAGWYNEMLEGLVRTPKILNGFYSSWAQYTVVCKNLDQRENLWKGLRRENMPAMVYYAKSMHEQKAFKKQEDRTDDFGNTLYLKDRVLSLPIHPYLERKQAEEVVRKIEDIVSA